MCGRFTISNPNKIQSKFNTINKLPLFEPSWNIAPSQTIPTITRNSPNKIIMMKWGFMFSKSSLNGTINIRIETTFDKSFFKHFLLSNRCIIPADGFYEWGNINLEGKEEKYPFYFFLKDNDLFAFAGLYNNFKDAEGKDIFSFAILTCPPNSVVKKIHHRMPVILEKNKIDDWLETKNKDFDNIHDILMNNNIDNLSFYLVSKRVNNPNNDDIDLIKPYKFNEKN